MVFFEKVSLVPPDPIFGLTTAFQSDPRKTKVNLGAGVYKNEQLVTPILSSVKQAEAFLTETEMSKEYLPISGDQNFIDQIGQLVFGSDFWTASSDRVASFQTPGGTGALSIGGDFLKKEINAPLFLPNPTWPNHKNIFNALGFNVGVYPYYDFDQHVVQFEKTLSFFKTLPSQSILLFHASCHNPTGADLSIEQWRQLAELCENNQLLPFFDCAYQGFGEGIEQDVGPIRLFAARQIDMLVAVSQSKNFSLYGERVGALYAVAQKPDVAENVRSRIKQVIRTHYSNPPMHGAKIAAHILQTPHLRALWLQELEAMRTRINTVRRQFTEALSRKVPDKDLSYMQSGNGMFCFTGLNRLQVETIRQDGGIYMTADGRINICGLNSSNMDYVAQTMAAVMEKNGGSSCVK